MSQNYTSSRARYEGGRAVVFIALGLAALVAIGGIVLSLYVLSNESEKDRTVDAATSSEVEDDATGALGGAPIVVPQFRFIDQDGAEFGSDEMLGEVNLVSFQFTRCPGICHTMSARLAQIYADNAAWPGLRIVTISVDPEHDTPEVLRAYADKFGVTDTRWTFLNGPMDDVIELSEKGFFLPADSLPAGHSSRFALVDTEGEVRGFFDSLDDEQMLELETALVKMRAEMRASTSAGS